MKWDYIAEMCFQISMAAMAAAMCIGDGLAGGRSFTLYI
jgi:hypothetical protein